MTSTVTRQQLEAMTDQGKKLEKIRLIIKGEIKLIKDTGVEFFETIFPGIRK